jgi:predicted N-acetyltransferase YhbS
LTPLSPTFVAHFGCSMPDPLVDKGRHRLEILQPNESHAEAVAEFIRAVWNQSATASSVLAARATATTENLAEPGVVPPTWVAIRDGRVVGYVTTIPIRMWDGQRDWPAYWIKGLMVLPEYRNGPIGYALMKAAVARLPRSGGLAVAAPARRLFGALGYSDLGAIPNWVRPLAPGRMLGRLDFDSLGVGGVSGWVPAAVRLGKATGLAALSGGVAGAALRCFAAAQRWGGRCTVHAPFEPAADGQELDGLWHHVRRSVSSGVVRDHDYLTTRYPLGLGSPYVWLAVRNGERLAGIAVLRQPRADGDPRLRGVRVATLVDMIYDPAQSAEGLALLGAIESAARTLEADAILATCSAPELVGLLRRQCYLPFSGNVHFLFRDVADEGSGFGHTLAEWWLTRGDGNSDEVF